MAGDGESLPQHPVFHDSSVVLKAREIDAVDEASVEARTATRLRCRYFLTIAQVEISVARGHWRSRGFEVNADERGDENSWHDNLVFLVRKLKSGLLSTSSRALTPLQNEC